MHPFFDPLVGLPVVEANTVNPTPSHMLRHPMPLSAGSHPLTLTPDQQHLRVVRVLRVGFAFNAMHTRPHTLAHALALPWEFPSLRNAWLDADGAHVPQRSLESLGL